MKTVLLVIQIILALAVIVLILLQSRGAGLGSAFGGLGGSYSTKRGVEKVVFYLTIALVVLFFISSIIQLIIT